MVRLNYIFSGLLLVVTLVICFNAAF
ncbi:MAG: hypothetical protein K0S04_1580, partial [Herbinix sp.]|nr:hypothetical protein [Herbinix sp.]